MSTEQEYSYVLPTIFPLDPSGHAEPPSLAYMGACKLLRKLHPDAPLVDGDQSEQLANGDWLLRDLYHVTICIVTVDGKVQLVDAPDEPRAAPVVKGVPTQGYEVHEGPAPAEPVIVLAEVLFTTVWRCGGCGVRWRKSGLHAGATKRCRQCGRESVLRAPK